jgi:hypothetical protein
MSASRIFVARRIILSFTALLVAAVPAGFSQSGTSSHADAINSLADRPQARYVYPDIGKKYAAMLRGNLASGKYSGITEPEALATQLTADLQSVAPDGHLKVQIEGKIPSSAMPRRGPPGQVDVPSVAETKWIADGIAYIRFNQFAGEPESVAAVEQFMKDHLTARAIIIDTRSLTRGGGLAEMNVIFPYLFDRETVLVDMEVPKAGLPRGEPPPDPDRVMRAVDAPPELNRLAHVAIPHPTEHGLAKAKVFYLTSPRTRSAAEHFALALQRTHRGVIIGERTAGANHFGGFEPIGEGLVVFVPLGRTFDPDTGKDWEGDGIKPDIEVPADQALDKALELARQ